jgi:hypothetical protein
MANPNPSTAAAAPGKSLESPGTWVDIAAASPLFAYEPQRNGPAGWTQDTSGGSSCSRGGGPYAVGLDGVYCQSILRIRYHRLTLASHGSDIHLDRQPRLRRFCRYRWSTPFRSSFLRWRHPQRSSRSPCHPARSIYIQHLSSGWDRTHYTISEFLPILRSQDQYCRQPFWVSFHENDVC